MYAGNIATAIPADDLAEIYYADLHGAYDAMYGAFEKRQAEGMNQDYIASRLDVDKGLISKRLNGRKNLTLRILSYMATALDCKLAFQFVRYEDMQPNNYYFGCITPDIISFGPKSSKTASGGARFNV